LQVSYVNFLVYQGSDIANGTHIVVFCISGSWCKYNI